MKTIKITSSVPQWPLARQIPGDSTTWRGFRFCINDDTNTCDYWFILDDLTKPETVNCNPNNVFLYAQEPPEIKSYPESYLNQFSKIITCHKSIKHPGKIVYQQSLPWMVGVKFAHNRYLPPVTKSYDELTKMKPPAKTKLVSVIVSSKNQTKGHRQRLDFVSQLKKVLGDKLDIYGSGFEHVPDKWDGIAPYKFHVVLENSSLDDYWTEKLADAYLAYSLPIYWGCTNISSYFNKQSFESIDIYRPIEAINKIKRIVKEDITSPQFKAVKTSRDKILNEYQLFPEIIRLIDSHVASGHRSDISECVTLKDQNSFKPNHIPGWLSRAVQFARKTSTG